MQSFELYLNDEIFVDYFNTFLSLPVSMRRKCMWISNFFSGKLQVSRKIASYNTRP